MRVVKYFNTLPRGVANAPLLEIFKTSLERVLSSMINLKISQLISGGLDLDDLLRSCPTQTIVWFTDMYVLVGHTVCRTESREIKLEAIYMCLMWSMESILLAFIKYFYISTGKSETRLKLNINFTSLFQEVTIYEVLAPSLLASICLALHKVTYSILEKLVF